MARGNWIVPGVFESGEDYDLPNYYGGPNPAIFEVEHPSGGQILAHNVFTMDAEPVTPFMLRLQCPKCGYAIDVWKETAEHRTFTCGGEHVKVFPPYEA